MCPIYLCAACSKPSQQLVHLPQLALQVYCLSLVLCLNVGLWLLFQLLTVVVMAHCLLHWNQWSVSRSHCQSFCSAVYCNLLRSKSVFLTFSAWSNIFFDFLTLSYSLNFWYSLSSNLCLSEHNDLCNSNFSLWYDCLSFLFPAFLFIPANFSEVTLIHGLGFTYFLSPWTSTAIVHQTSLSCSIDF